MEIKLEDAIKIAEYAMQEVEISHPLAADALEAAKRFDVSRVQQPASDVVYTAVNASKFI